MVGSAGLGTPIDPSPAKASGPHVAWAELDEGSGVFHVLFSELVTEGWSAPLILAGPIAVDPIGELSVELSPVDAEDRLLVTWLDTGAAFPGVQGRQFDGTTWQPASPVMEGAGIRFDLAVDPNTWTMALAAHGQQPTCPCNQVSVATGTGGAFGDADAIGTGHTGTLFEWPQELWLHLTQVGRPVLAWRHESWDESLSMVDERLIVAWNLSGTWTFDQELGIGRDVREPSVTTNSGGEVAVAWCDDSSGSWNVYVAEGDPLISVAETPASPVLLRSLTPNPTRGAVHLIVGDALVGADAVVVDASGRRIASPIATAAGDVLWDGTDRLGRRVAPGVYHVGLRNGLLQAVHRIVVVR